jgi:hypothetical protein
MILKKTHNIFTQVDGDIYQKKTCPSYEKTARLFGVVTKE